MPIFFMLNGLGLVFLLYALANFWKEEQRTKRALRQRAADGERARHFEPIIVTHPISHTAQGGLAEIPLRALAGETGERFTPRVKVSHRRVGLHHTVVEMPLRGTSTASAAENLPRGAKIAAKDGSLC